MPPLMTASMLTSGGRAAPGIIGVKICSRGVWRSSTCASTGARALKRPRHNAAIWSSGGNPSPPGRRGEGLRGSARLGLRALRGPPRWGGGGWHRARRGGSFLRHHGACRLRKAPLWARAVTAPRCCSHLRSQDVRRAPVSWPGDLPVARTGPAVAVGFRAAGPA